MNNEKIVWTNGSTFSTKETGVSRARATAHVRQLLNMYDFIDVPIVETWDEYWLCVRTFGTAAMYVSELGSELERQKRKNDYVKTIIAYSDVNGLECYTGVCRRPRHSIKRSDTRTPASYRDPFAADFNWSWRKV